MLSNSKPMSSGLSGQKKKNAPPRPPPPSSNRIQTSQSFHTAQDLQNHKRNSFGQQRSSFSVDQRSSRAGRDLIDFSTPPESPRNAAVSEAKGPPDYMYRVGASVFYVKSQLKNPTVESQLANPFSPPRPSAQSLLASPAKGPQQPTLYNNVPKAAPTNSGNGQHGSTLGSSAAANSSTNAKKSYNPTIIKRTTTDNNNFIKSGPGNGNTESFRSSGSSEWSYYSVDSQAQQLPPQAQSHQEFRYGNVPLSTWDEPPAQNLPKPSLPNLPTIIKPLAACKPSLLPKPSLAKVSDDHITANSSEIRRSVPETKSYYDEPPDSDFDDDFNDDNSPPMPSEPPPPPPPDLAVDEWVDSTTTFAPACQDTVSDTQGVESDRAYAIALYDYLPDAEGDLPLQAGDLVYLTRQIDDAWLYGNCAGYEGMFPSNYVNVVVPLSDEQQNPQKIEPKGYCYADVLYQFDAETESDLNLRAGDVVTIYGRLNDDWFYGEVNGTVGQFPAAFVGNVPTDLPSIPSDS